MVPILVLGWWLVLQSRGQAQLRPSLSMSPSHDVALRDRVTLRCHVPRHNGRATLHKEGLPHPLWHQDAVRGAAEFPIPAARREDAGRYWCRYEIKGERPEESERVELVLRDPTYPRPHISLSPGAVVTQGTSLSIQCQGLHGATFVLHREGSSAPVQRQTPGGHRASFSISHASWVDSGTYSCSYHPPGQTFVSSSRSIFMELQVEEEEEEEESGSAFLPASPDATQAWPVLMQGSPRPTVTGTSSPSRTKDFTVGNAVRLALGSVLLILLLLLVAKALQNYRQRGQGL